MMLSRLSLGTLAVLSCSLAIACGTKDDPEMTEVEFCQDYARRECAAIAPVCAYAPASCEPTRITECQNRIVLWRNATGGTRPFRVANATACLNKVTETYAMPLITGEAALALEELCARVFQGTATSLQACTVDLDCDGTLICDKRLCAERKPVAAGALCANPGEVCVASESCKLGPAGAVLQCSPRQALGAACSDTDPCLESLRCTATCEEKVATGGACTKNTDCLSGYCSAFSRACGAGLSFAEGSSSCNAYSGAMPAPAAAVPPN